MNSIDQMMQRLDYAEHDIKAALEKVPVGHPLGDDFIHLLTVLNQTKRKVRTANSVYKVRID